MEYNMEKIHYYLLGQTHKGDLLKKKYNLKILFWFLFL